MRFTDFALIDPIMSIGVAIFILVNAARNLHESLELFLEKAPHDIDISEIKEHLLHIDGVLDVHHIHVWSMDGQNNYATMHIVTETKNIKELKQSIKEELNEHGISHSTIEIERKDECCKEEECHIKEANHKHHHHHH